MTTRESAIQAEALDRARVQAINGQTERATISAYERHLQAERERAEYLQRQAKARAEYEAQAEQERLQRQAETMEIIKAFQDNTARQAEGLLWDATADIPDLRTREALYEALKATRDSFLEA